MNFDELIELPEGSIVETPLAVYRKQDHLWWASDAVAFGSSFLASIEHRVVRLGPGDPWTESGLSEKPATEPEGDGT